MNGNVHQASKNKLVGHTGKPRIIKIANNLVQFMKDIQIEEKALPVWVVLKYCIVTHPDFIKKYTEGKANPYASLMQVI
jgi:hypothetical protein